MANTPAAVTLPAQQSTVISAAGGSLFRIHNRTQGGIFVRLAAAAAGPAAGAYDLFIPPGIQYISAANEYVGEMRAWSEAGGTVNVSVDA